MFIIIKYYIFHFNSLPTRKPQIIFFNIYLILMFFFLFNYIILCLLIVKYVMPVEIWLS